MDWVGSFRSGVVSVGVYSRVRFCCLLFIFLLIYSFVYLVIFSEFFGGSFCWFGGISAGERVFFTFGGGDGRG